MISGTCWMQRAHRSWHTMTSWDTILEKWTSIASFLWSRCRIVAYYLSCVMCSWSHRFIAAFDCSDPHALFYALFVCCNNLCVFCAVHSCLYKVSNYHTDKLICKKGKLYYRSDWAKLYWQMHLSWFLPAGSAAGSSAGIVFTHGPFEQEDKREDYQKCSMLYCVPQLYPLNGTHTSSSYR